MVRRLAAGKKPLGEGVDLARPFPPIWLLGSGSTAAC
jgi:hypothetical protein